MNNKLTLVVGAFLIFALLYACTKDSKDHFLSNDQAYLESSMSTKKANSKEIISAGTLNTVTNLEFKNGQIKWAATPEADSYEVQYREKNGEWLGGFTHERFQELDGLSEGVVYQTQVRAWKGSQSGDWTSIDFSLD